MHHRIYIGTQLQYFPQQKKRKYTSAAEAPRASFTPFVVSTDGMLGREVNFLLKRLAQSISIKWEKPQGQTTGWLHACKAEFCNTSSNKSLQACVVLAPSGEVVLEWMSAGLPAELPKSN